MKQTTRKLKSHNIYKIILFCLLLMLISFSENILIQAQSTDIDTSINSPELIKFPTNYDGLSVSTVPYLEPTIAVGLQSIAVTINFKIAVYDKGDPGVVKYQYNFNDWFLQFQNLNYDIFDPVIVYDLVNNRFIMLAVSRNLALDKAYFSLAISKNSNPLARTDWCFYDSDATVFGQTDEEFLTLDRPMMSVDGNSGLLYLTGKMFSHNGTSPTGFEYTKLRILDLAQLYSTNCSSTTGTDIKNFTDKNGNSIFHLLPVQRFDGGTAYFISAKEAGANYLSLFTLQNTLTNPATNRIDINDIPAYSPFFTIRQPVDEFLNHSQGVSMLQAYFLHGTIWAVHDSKDIQNLNGSVRLYKYTGVNATDTSRREGGGNVDYSFGSLAVNNLDQVMLVWNASSPTQPEGFVSIRFGEQGLPSNVLYPGEGIANDGWGDYAGQTIDPNRTDFWVVHMYAQADGEPGIRIASTLGTPDIVFMPLVSK